MSMIARLLLVTPLSIGALLAEGIFAAHGAEADPVSLPSAVAAWLLLWLGTAYALRSWVAVLLTFVPAALMTLGAAMVGDLAPGAGITLLAVGGTLLLTIIWSRLVNPARRWTPGWSAPPSAPEVPTAGADDGTAGSDDDVPDDVPHPPRRAPAWDTSRTDIGARDALVFDLCQRGGTVGPTLVTLEEFFTGNGDPRSIAPGLRGAVSLGHFAAVLHGLRSRSDVGTVAVQVEPLESGAYPAGEWPTAGSIQVIGTLASEDLDAAVDQLHGEAPIGPLPVDRFPDGTVTPEGSVEYALWWA